MRLGNSCHKRDKKNHFEVSRLTIQMPGILLPGFFVRVQSTEGFNSHHLKTVTLDIYKDDHQNVNKPRIGKAGDNDKYDQSNHFDLSVGSPAVAANRQRKTMH